MRQKRITTEPPVITEEGFEDSLATDNLLVDYFNEFLSLPTFPKAVRFNVDYGVFEVVTDAPNLLEKQLKRILYEQTPRNPIYDVIRKEKYLVAPTKVNGSTKEDTTLKINYSIMALDCEQSIQWIKKERLPAFLESDCYFEYRLAKLISQVRWSKSGMNMHFDPLYKPWVTKKPDTPPPTLVEDENELIMKKYYVSLGQSTVTQTQEWFTKAKQNQCTVTTFSLPTYMMTTRIQDKVLEESDNISIEYGKKDSTTSSGSTKEAFDLEGSVSIRDTSSHALMRMYLERQQENLKNLEVVFPSLEELAISYTNFIMKSAVSKLVQRPFIYSEEDIDFNNVSRVIIQDQKEEVEKKISDFSTEIKEKAFDENLELVSLCSRSESIGSDARADWCISHKAYDIGTRKEFERFKKFMKGTPGEKCRWLWMDIERLKVLKDSGRRQRHLEKMRKCYLVSSGEGYLTPEVLRKLNLKDGSSWNEPYLRSIQAEVLKPLLQYWGPRFCVTHKYEIKTASAELKFWHSRQEQPRKDIDPFPQMVTLLPLRPKSCMPQIPPLKYLYAMYVAPSATFDIGLEKKKKKDIYMKIDPPFEDLFDAAEEYILLLLLEPWIEMVKSDQNNYEQVEQVKQDRQLDSLYFRKLQAIHKETVPKKEEIVPDLPVPYISKETQLWNKVPNEFKHLDFNYLIHNKLEFEHFRQFLASHSASMDLMCWTDIEQFRRMPHQDKKQREAKSIEIKNKYLNKKYFFGPNSPATKEQQDEMMRFGGGWGMILHEQLASPVLLEIQKCVQRRLENMWLPLFLSSEQYRARQKIKFQMEDIAEDLILKKRVEKIGVWKPEESKWIASSSDIIAFRKALLNPVIAASFQQFVSVKGELLGNGVLFWQEVQKYKDLCHSHCEDSIIQNKITSIINCFLNSSIPPALQIDLPFDQAQKIIEHRKELGPYVFREAQMTIFGVLFKYWPQFCEFQSNLTDEKAVTTLERRKEFKKNLGTSAEDNTLKDESRATISVSGSRRLSSSALNIQPHNRTPSWCYSKYIEALAQERTLLKIQEDLEKKLAANNLAGPSTTSTKTFSSNLNLNAPKSKFKQDQQEET